MVVTRQDYTVLPPWTQDELAGAFLNAFVDAGLILNWTDSFLSGTVENRVLKVTHDAERTYGTVYYWLKFDTLGWYLAIAGGWDNQTHLPTGTQLFDWLDNSPTLTSTNWGRKQQTLANTQAVVISRYTSGIDPRFSWFAVKNGSSVVNFHITPGSAALVPWLDLDVVRFHHILSSKLTITTYRARAAFTNQLTLRRAFNAPNCMNHLSTSYRNYYVDYWGHETHCFHAWGSEGDAGATIGNFESGDSKGIVLPVALAADNPALTADRTPIFNGIPHSLYLRDPMPEDFGISFYFDSNTMQYQDRMVVTQGIDEWEIIDVANATDVADRPSAVFLAKTV